LRQALCFGTRSDAFNLSAVAGRGTLVPRANAKFTPPKQKKQRAKNGHDPGLLFTPSAAE